MNEHKVIVVLVEKGKKQIVVAPLEFDRENRPFAVYETWHRKGQIEVIGKDRIPLNPQFLEKLKIPNQGADYFYKSELVSPEPEKN